MSMMAVVVRQAAISLVPRLRLSTCDRTAGGLGAGWPAESAAPGRRAWPCCRGPPCAPACEWGTLSGRRCVSPRGAGSRCWLGSPPLPRSPSDRSWGWPSGRGRRGAAGAAAGPGSRPSSSAQPSPAAGCSGAPPGPGPGDGDRGRPANEVRGDPQERERGGWERERRRSAEGASQLKWRE